MKKIKTIISLLIISGWFTSSAQSLILNGDFSEGINNGWSLRTGNNSFSEENGALRAKIIENPTNWWDFGIINSKQDNTISMGQTVIITFKAESEQTGSKVKCTMYSPALDADNPQYSHSIDLPLEANPKVYTVEIPITSVTRSNWQFNFFFLNTGIFLIDDFVVEIKKNHDTPGFPRHQSLGFDDIDNHFINPPNEFRIIHYSMDGNYNSSVLDEMENYGIGGIQTSVPYNNYLQSESGWFATASFINQANERDFQVWIHDELGYPSGAAGGLVVDGHPEFEVCGLVRLNKTGTGTGTFSLDLPSDLTFIHASICQVVNGEPDFSTAQALSISGNKVVTTGLPGNWQLSLFGEKILDKDTQAQSTIQQFGQTGHYPSLLNKAACARFIELTHQNYANRIQPIASKIDVFYTGEANLMASYWNDVTSRAQYPYVPWERTISNSFILKHGYDLMPHLDALFSGNSKTAQTVRLHYYQTIADVVADNYAGQITAWCEQNGVRSMGHPLLEEDIICHVFNYGDMLHFLRKFHIPGCDLHIGRENYTTWNYWMGKYISSAASLDDRDTATVMGLLDPIIGYGMNDLTPEIPVLRRTVNMNLLCGINQFTSYMPYNNPTDGYNPVDYKQFNDYVSRITMVLRGSKNEAPIAMYYPIQTFQSKYLASDRHFSLVTADFRDKQDVVDNLAKEILNNGLDFNFVTDDVLLNSMVQGGKLQIGTHRYSQLVMPNVEVISLQVLKKILQIKDAGIPVHWVHSTPTLGFANSEHDEVIEIAQSLLTNNTPISDLKKILYNEIPLSFESSDPRLNMVRFNKEGKQIYFVVNDSRNDMALSVSSETVKSLKIYNPVDGNIKVLNLPFSRKIGGYESLLLIETDEVGILDDQKPEKDDFFLYPNPSASNVTLEVKPQQVGEIVEISDLMGRSVLRTTIDNEIFQLDVSNLSPGLFLIRIPASMVSKRFLKVD